ncbi:hypothetical protein ABID82_002281 [Methylobacterium sp. PvP062]|uniref:Uncharacterized protein n=1 Tax=Methylobacterium radiotolerans TaxID=31998 RepID=A0ABV2NN51_9HYPH|nr:MULTISPECIES: hypothetical protein [unclassified Methylobacterium]MBP2495386.1 hypothetical protein [Methylobacterium sp. PvP105]MBP2504743.1 hypothetical protein [Methylobacterium sp. PvP109]MCX7335753.1 hypothetical protein [Hyphomicrobiales bacterium]
MTPADAIASLDRQIAEHGQSVSLRRVVANAPALEKGCKAWVRGYRPNELVGGLQQGDTLLIFSPTDLPAEFVEEPLERGDGIKVDGLLRTVQFTDPVRLKDVLVRLNVTVRGGN